MVVAVKVHPTVYEFIVDTYESDIITPQKEDILWGLVKYNLTTYDKSAQAQMKNPEHCIYIELLSTSFQKSLTRDKGYIKLDPMYRCFLTKSGEERISKELRERFKSSFHTFVLGALAANPRLQQKEAFERFIEHFNLSQNAITYEMLKKSWDRSKHKKSLFEDKKFCSILF